MKAAKDANWGCGGLMFLFLALANLIYYLITGSALLGPRSSVARNVWPWLGSVFFFVLGVAGISIWFVLLIFRRRE